MTRAEHLKCKQISFLARYKVATYEELYQWEQGRLETEYNTLKAIKTQEHNTKVRK